MRGASNARKAALSEPLDAILALSTSPKDIDDNAAGAAVGVAEAGAAKGKKLNGLLRGRVRK
jgi:hypothetical protein